MGEVNKENEESLQKPQKIIKKYKIKEKGLAICSDLRRQTTSLI